MPGSEDGGEYQSGNANDNELGLRELSETQSYVMDFTPGSRGCSTILGFDKGY